MAFTVISKPLHKVNVYSYNPLQGTGTDGTFPIFRRMGIGEHPAYLQVFSRSLRAIIGAAARDVVRAQFATQEHTNERQTRLP